MKFKTDWGILDVTKGRKKLAKRMARGEQVRVTLEAVIYDTHSGDDGTSIEFQMRVEEMKIHDG